MGEMRPSDWLMKKVLRSDWLVPILTYITTILIGQHGSNFVGCIRSASPVAVTNTTVACHCSRAMHEHYRTHKNIPIVLESSELIAFSTEADRGFVKFDPARTGTHQSLLAYKNFSSQYHDKDKFG